MFPSPQLASSLAPRFRLVRQLQAVGMGALYLAEQIAVGNRPGGAQGSEPQTAG